MRKILLIILLLLTLTACDNKYDVLNKGFVRGDYVEKIASDNNYKKYIFTIEEAYNYEYDDAYIITFYIDGLRYVKTTYLAYRIDDELHWEVISIE